MTSPTKVAPGLFYRGDAIMRDTPGSKSQRQVTSPTKIAPGLFYRRDAWSKRMIGQTHTWELEGYGGKAVVFATSGEEDAPADWEVWGNTGSVVKKGRGTVKAARKAAETALASVDKEVRAEHLSWKKVDAMFTAPPGMDMQKFFSDDARDMRTHLVEAAKKAGLQTDGRTFAGGTFEVSSMSGHYVVKPQKGAERRFRDANAAVQYALKVSTK